MSQLRAWLTSPLTINQTFHYSGKTHDLHTRLRELSNSSRIEENYYRVDATISIGTMMTKGALRKLETGIRIHVQIKPGNESLQQINMYTKVRPENWALLLIFTFFFIVMVLTREAQEGYVYVAGVSICFLWFNFIYKVQEWILLNKIVRKLKLKE